MVRFWPFDRPTNQNAELTIFLAEMKAKQETIQSKKVEDALKRPRAVLDAETQKILHSFLQGEYCLSFGFSLTRVGSTSEPNGFRPMILIKKCI